MDSEGSMTEKFRGEESNDYNKVKLKSHSQTINRIPMEVLETDNTSIRMDRITYFKMEQNVPKAATDKYEGTCLNDVYEEQYTKTKRNKFIKSCAFPEYDTREGGPNSEPVSAFSTWEKELHKIVFDPRYLLLNSEERKQVFEQFVKTRIKEEYKEKKSKLLQAKEEFRKLLEECKLTPRYTTTLKRPMDSVFLRF
nr:PREDICTED: transcription elongation regulator 1-like protein [Latimeria chalumnae]|eukprot:XP_014352192.1 PREDICTED: transcription elongation regulator 1-like protein [Latimeria chalumnae]